MQIKIVEKNMHKNFRWVRQWRKRKP